MKKSTLLLAALLLPTLLSAAPGSYSPVTIALTETYQGFGKPKETRAGIEMPIKMGKGKIDTKAFLSMLMAKVFYPGISIKNWSIVLVSDQDAIPQKFYLFNPAFVAVDISQYLHFDDTAPQVLLAAAKSTTTAQNALLTATETTKLTATLRFENIYGTISVTGLWNGSSKFSKTKSGTQLWLNGAHKTAILHGLATYPSQFLPDDESSILAGSITLGASIPVENLSTRFPGL